MFGNQFGPAGEFSLGIIFFAQPKVTKVTGEPDRRGKCFVFGQAKRRALRLQAVEDVFVKPGSVTKLKRAVQIAW